MNPYTKGGLKASYILLAGLNPSPRHFSDRGSRFLSVLKVRVLDLSYTPTGSSDVPGPVYEFHRGDPYYTTLTMYY